MMDMNIVIDDKAVILEFTSSEAYENYDQNRKGFNRYFRELINLNKLALIIIKKPLAARPNTDRDQIIK